MIEGLVPQGTHEMDGSELDAFEATEHPLMFDFKVERFIGKWRGTVEVDSLRCGDRAQLSSPYSLRMLRASADGYIAGWLQGHRKAKEVQ